VKFNGFISISMKAVVIPKAIRFLRAFVRS
jgi:hypothetical protein